MPPHVDACRRISVVLAARSSSGTARDERPCAPGSVCIKGGDLVHHDRYGPAGSELLAVLLPDPLLAALDLESRWRDWSWLHEGAPRRAALRLAVAGVQRDGTVAIAAALGELAAHLREPAERARPPAPTRSTWSGSARASTTADARAARHRASRATPASTPRGRAHFRRAFGCSLRVHRQRLRSVRPPSRCSIRSDRSRKSRSTTAFFDLSHPLPRLPARVRRPAGRFRRELAGREPPQSCKTSWTVAV
jgi:hypothetical protein